MVQEIQEHLTFFFFSLFFLDFFFLCFLSGSLLSSESSLVSLDFFFFCFLPSPNTSTNVSGLKNKDTLECMCCTGFTNTLPIEARRGASPGWRNSHCAYLFPLFSAVIKILLAELITLSSSGSKTSISRPWPKLLKFVLFSYYKIEQLVYEKH